MEPKFEYTLNNHFKWGWGDEWYGAPQPDQRYKMHYGYTTRPWGSLRQEAVKAAELIASKATKPIMIGLSGGSDSQMACLSFMDANVPFKVLIARYKYTTGEIINQHDISVAYEFCKKFNIEYVELEIDIDEFFKSRGPELAKRYCMPKFELILQTAAMDYACKDYCYIMAGGDTVIYALGYRYAKQFGLKYYEERFTEPCCMESPVPILQHMITEGYEGTSKFWLYTPELIASYLMDPVTQDFLKTFDVVMSAWLEESNKKQGWKLYHWLYKPMMTYREFPEMIRSRKFTGYENLYPDLANVPGRMNVYHQMLKRETIELGSEKTIVYTIDQLIKYITTPHTEQEVFVDNGVMA